MTSEPTETPGLTLPPAPTPAWEVLQNLQQDQENQDIDHDDAETDEGFDGHSDSDLDSALGSNVADSTYSLTSSIFEYRTLHGRTYHSDRGTAQYWASNDDQASQSLDLAYLGHVEVVGTEISPIQPTWMPSNLQLEIEDCNDTWTFRPDSFDFIHMRFMLGSITDWTATFREAFTACVPGGWVESYEVSSTMESDDNSIPDGSAMKRWGEVFEEGGQRAGRSFAIIREDVQRKSMEEAGFANIHVVDLKAPVGGWHTEERLKQVGHYMQAALERDYEGYLLFLACELLGWTEEQVRALCTQLRREIRSGQHHPYFRQRIVYGQKPEV
ncbi:methyltransferase [Fusarium tjaetaba]|uniref:Methyltransferase n=1 Tax=Fusarium tjaetaba TaxID=1567544 RepID=A0A8H5VVX3_9HYPO|nr:methyltransferase [Fusarium tjaetaba]KAF5639467.1 methyltransferase [Fusarium tjaetaba]